MIGGHQVGQISRRFDGGFHVKFAGVPDDHKTLAAKINWQKKRSVRQITDKRDAPRQRPRNPTAHFYLGDEEHECFIIDVSFSGAGVSSTKRPPIGTALRVGHIAGRVVRHIEVGFGLQFDAAQNPASLGRRAEFPPQHIRLRTPGTRPNGVRLEGDLLGACC